MNGELIVTDLLPVPDISIDGVVGATSLFADNLISVGTYLQTAALTGKNLRFFNSYR